MEPTTFARLAASHPAVVWLDAAAPAATERYLLARRLATPNELPCRIERAGDGNMNLVLRVALRGRSVVLKQGRPWVEKYDHIAAPWERTLVEGWFYKKVRNAPVVAAGMPRLVHLDGDNHILVLEDLGPGADWPAMYSRSPWAPSMLEELLLWLRALGALTLGSLSQAVFANRAMRTLNHEHIFSLPLRDRNGLDLDAITPGLAAIAGELRQDRAYCGHVAELGARYLSDGVRLVHGDFFPGSWIPTASGVRIIDPEFCFLGAREFDYGNLLAHLAFARQPHGAPERVLAAAHDERLDVRALLGFAGTEIMRRLIGVAQLPVVLDLDAKRRLLDLSRRLVLPEGEGLAWC